MSRARYGPHRERPAQPRVPLLPASEWDADLDELKPGLARRDGEPLNIYAALANHPKLMKRWLVFGRHVLNKSTLPARDRELAILRTGWCWRAAYEWGQHAAIARRAGLTDDDLARVVAGPDVAGWEPHEAALLRAVDDLVDDGCVRDATWDELAAHYTTEQVLDIVFCVGQYTLVSFALNSLGVPRDDGVEGLPGED